MDCRDVVRMIDTYWDRDLPPDQTARIRAHLSQCPVCHGEFGRLDEWLTSPEPVLVPAGLRDRVLTAVLEAVDASVDHVADRSDRRQIAATRLQETGATGTLKHYWLVPLAWAGALAACIALLFLSQPHQAQPAISTVSVPDPVMIPSLVAAAFQPSPLAAAGAAMAQAAALEQVTQPRSERALPLRTERRPLRADWVPLDVDPNVQQLPAVISAMSPLGA